MLYSITTFVALASLAAALPSNMLLSRTIKPTSAQTSVSKTVQHTSTAAPLNPDAAVDIFENKDLHTVTRILPLLFSVPSHPPTTTATPITPTAVEVPPPSGTNIHQSSPPRIPSTGNIQVKPPETIPISSVLGGNQSLPFPHAPRGLDARAACQNYPYCCPDPRYLNENTAFPYNVIGRFASNVGSCTGTLVGPRHVLTAAHCISWDVCHKTLKGSHQFAVDYWPGHAPAIFYGEAVHFYYASACGDPQNVVQQGVDYVVVILSQYTNLPYMGVKAYSPSWNGGRYWYQQGYAANAGGTLYPYVQGPFPVVNQFPEGFGDLLEYAACDTPGDSGSPVWAWWNDGPHIIGLMTEVGYQLGANAGWGPAGQAMINLITQALAI